MTLSMNQFTIEPVAGDLSLPRTGMVISGQVAASESTSIVPAQAVKLDTSAPFGGVPQVLAMTADSDPVFAVAIRNLKNPSFVANDALELAQRNSVIWMTAGAAMNPGVFVRFAYATKKVVAAATGNYSIIGSLLDKATADGAVVRVLLQVPETESTTA